MTSLREIREGLSLSQATLADMVGCTQGSIGHYESGRRIPSLKMCRSLVAALNKLGAEVRIDDVFPPDRKAA